MSPLLLPFLLPLGVFLGAAPAAAQDPAAPVPAAQDPAAPSPAAPAPAAADAAGASRPVPPWYIGLPIAQVTLEAPEGGLPRENLEPLLRVRQGGWLDLGDVRQDVALLVRAGAFASVEVDAEPWLSVDEEGQFQDAVRLTYRVYPPPRVGRVVLDAPRGELRRAVDDALGFGLGEPFFPRRDAPTAERRVQQALVAAGWPEARVQVESVELEARGDEGTTLELRVSVEPGSPRTLSRVSVAPTLPITEKQLRKALRKRADLRIGGRISDEAAREARQAVQDLLAAAGYYDPRTNLLFSPEAREDAPGAEVLAVLGEAGPRTEVVAIGRGLPQADRLPEILGLGAGSRLTEGTVEEGVRRLRDWLQARGHYAPVIETRVDRVDEDALLVIEVERGPAHRVRRFTAEDGSVFREETLVRAMREAAPDSLDRRVVVDDALAGVERSVEELYRGQGRLAADASIEVQTTGPARWRPLFRRVVPLEVALTVEEGPETRLGALQAVGADERTADTVAAARARLVGGAYLPGELELLRQELVEDLRARGHLGAEVGIDADVADGVATVQLQIEPGPEVRLRSVVIQGNHQTRRTVIARELAVTIGEPLTPAGLEETRRRLYDLDLFRTVTLELVGQGDRARDLIVRVEERPELLFEIGGGVATDRGVLARGRVAHRNLGGLGHSITLLTQAGYAWSGDSWRLDTVSPEWSAGARYEAPNLPTRGQRLVIEGIFREENQAPTWRLAESGGSVGVRVRLGEGSDAFLAYAARYRQLEDVDPGALVDGDPWLSVYGMSGPDDSLPASLSEGRVVSGPELTLVLDRRDDALDPREGWRARGKLTIWDGLLEGSTTLRAETSVDELFPLGPLILAVGAQAGIGWAEAGGTLGVEDRFTLGGSGSLRGFQPESLGPANRVRRTTDAMPSQLEPLVRGTALADSPTHWVPTGGDAMAALSLELRTPFSSLGLGDSDDVWVVTFADLGRVAFLSPTVLPTSRAEGRDPLLRYGLGGGVRVATPIGPVALLLGGNPAPIPERDEPPVILHFTLGEL